MFCRCNRERRYWCQINSSKECVTNFKFYFIFSDTPPTHVLWYLKSNIHIQKKKHPFYSYKNSYCIISRIVQLAQIISLTICLNIWICAKKIPTLLLLCTKWEVYFPIKFFCILDIGKEIWVNVSSHCYNTFHVYPIMIPRYFGVIFNKDYVIFGCYLAVKFIFDTF